MSQKLFFMLLVILLIFSGFVFGEENERRIALVIGNSDYQTSPLRNPVNDAEDMSIALVSLGPVNLQTTVSHFLFLIEHQAYYMFEKHKVILNTFL